MRVELCQKHAESLVDGTCASSFNWKSYHIYQREIKQYKKKSTKKRSLFTLKSRSLEGAEWCECEKEMDQSEKFLGFFWSSCVARLVEWIKNIEEEEKVLIVKRMERFQVFQFFIFLYVFCPMYLTQFHCYIDRMNLRWWKKFSHTFSTFTLISCYRWKQREKSEVKEDTHNLTQAVSIKK